MTSLPVRPLIMWIEDVIHTSGTAREEYQSPEWRARFRLWRDAGETVKSGADMLRKWPWPKDEIVPTGRALRDLRERMAARSRASAPSRRDPQAVAARLALLEQVRAENVHGARSKYGDCELVADEFLSAARRAGLASEKDSCIAWGTRAFCTEFAARRGILEKVGQHQWAVIDGLIYDGTSDQFADDVFTLAEVGDPRYNEMRRVVHTFRR